MTKFRQVWPHIETLPLVAVDSGDLTETDHAAGFGSTTNLNEDNNMTELKEENESPQTVSFNREKTVANVALHLADSQGSLNADINEDLKLMGLL